MRALACLGDNTTYGSIILATATWSEGNKPVAQSGDLASCSMCKGTFPIIGTAVDWSEKQPYVATGDRVACKCPNHVVFGSTTMRTTIAPSELPIAPRAPDISPSVQPFASAAASPEKPSPHAASERPMDGVLEEEEEEEELESNGITLRLGLFFDGTGDNVQNAQMGAMCLADDLEYASADRQVMVKRCKAFQREPRSSYQRQPTNIAPLYELYTDDTYKPVSNDENQVCIRVYAPGVGTQVNEPDTAFPDMALGTGERGVEAQVNVAIKKAQNLTRRLASENPTLQINRIIVDLFGFSRGAAAARHCLNDLRSGRASQLAIALSKSALISSNGSWQLGKNFQIGVLGLFDTVAAIGSVTDGWDVNDANNGNIDLYLAPGCAQKVIHLVAADEHRHNFSLNSVEPGFKDIALPGAHGDLGGNYPLLMEERLLLTRSFRDQMDKQQPDEDSHAYRQANSELGRWQQRGLIDPELSNGRLYIDHHSIRSTENPLRRKNVYAQVRLERQVRGEYGRIPLRIMHALSMRAGAAFKAIDDANPDLAIPSQLQSIAEKMMSSAEQGRAITLTAMEHALLRAHYLHQSAHWNVYDGMSGALEVHRVDRPTVTGERARHPNRKATS